MAYFLELTIEDLLNEEERMCNGESKDDFTARRKPPHIIKSKYARRLHMVLKHEGRYKKPGIRMHRTFSITEFRELLGVPEGKLTIFGNLHTRAIKPAVLKINAHKEFCVRIECLAYGKNNVQDIRIHWYKKDAVGLEWISDLKTRESRREILNELGNRCVCCGDTEGMYLEVDHVFNDGKTDRAPTIKKIRKNRERYQLLCCNCNRAKHKNGGELYIPEQGWVIRGTELGVQL